MILKVLKTETMMTDSDDYGDEYDDNEVDTSAEEAAVEAAEEKVAEIQSEIDELKTSLEQARAIQAKCEERAALAQEAMQKIEQQKESFEASQSFHLKEIEELLSVAETRMAAAQNALNEYLAANPPAAQFEKWLHWSPQDKQIITPQHIHDRLNLSCDQLDLFAKNLYDRDRDFKTKIDHYREQYKAASGSAEKLAVSIQARRGGAGDFAEKLVVHAFQPIGTISTQPRTFFDDGKYTKTDLFVSNLKTPVILGRGDGMSAPVGGSVALEVKTGHADYLYRQKEHMEFQAKGHERANASMTVCSRDIKSLSQEKEAELRESLKTAGSPILGMLPSKDKLDGAVLRLISQNKD